MISAFAGMPSCSSRVGGGGEDQEGKVVGGGRGMGDGLWGEREREGGEGKGDIQSHTRSDLMRLFRR